MLKSVFSKGSFLASFFILISFVFISFVNSTDASENPSGLTDAILGKAASSTIWSALLHADDGRVYITDPSFLLAGQEYSPLQELKLTLAFLYSGEPANVCRFPARYLWLKKQLNLPELSLIGCPDLLELEQKVPVSELYLVFASENLTQPSSMMGHVLIKLSGVAQAGNQVDHAVSFYTDAASINLPKLFYQSIVTGKPGYFALTPYREKLLQYNVLENRNVWEYKLSADEFQRKLLLYHLHELKQSALTYYFDDYNCATLTQFVLSILANQKADPQVFGTTPTDVVKQIKEQGLIVKSELIPSPRWRLRMLGDSLSAEKRKAVKVAVDDNKLDNLTDSISTEEQFITSEIALSYVDFKYSIGAISEKEKNKLHSVLDIKKDNSTTYSIDVSEYKNPLKTPPDSQMSWGVRHRMDETFFTFEVVPSSHKLEDDNRQYFGETELTLGRTSVSISAKDSTMYLDEFNLYGIRSLIPRNQFTGGLSGTFGFGARRRFYRDFTLRSEFFLEGSLGGTIGLNKDMMLYGLIGARMALARKVRYVEATSELGLIIEEVWNMKTIVNVMFQSASANELGRQTNYNFTQSWYATPNWAFFIDLNRVMIDSHREDQSSLRLKYSF